MRTADTANPLIPQTGIHGYLMPVPWSVWIKVKATWTCHEHALTLNAAMASEYKLRRATSNNLPTMIRAFAEWRKP